MEVHKKPILSASQKPSRVKSHVIAAPTDQDPIKGTSFGCCRIDLKKKDSKYEQRRLDVRQIYTSKGRQGSSNADHVKFVTKVLIKKKSPKVQTKWEQVHEHEISPFIEGDVKKKVDTLELSSMTSANPGQLSSHGDSRNDAFIFTNTQTGLHWGKEETCQTILAEENRGNSTSENEASEFSCASEKTGQTSLSARGFHFPSRHDRNKSAFLCDKDDTMRTTGLTGNNGQGKTRQTSFLPANGNSPVRKELKSPICVVCAAGEIYESTLLRKTLDDSPIPESRDQTGKTGFLERRFDESKSGMAIQTNLLYKRRLSPSPSSDKLTPSLVADKTGQSLSSDSHDLCCFVDNDVTKCQTSFSKKGKLFCMEEHDCTSNSSLSTKSNCTLCFMKDFYVQYWTSNKTSQTGFPFKRCLHLPLVNLPDAFSNFENNHIHDDHFPNRYQISDAPTETDALTRSTEIKSEVQVNHLVRSLSNKLTRNKHFAKQQCRPTLFASPTIGEMNLLNKGPSNDRKNSQRTRAWSLPSVSRPDRVETVLTCSHSRCRNVDCSCYNQDTHERLNTCHSRCSAPSSMPY